MITVNHAGPAGPRLLAVFIASTGAQLTTYDKWGRHKHDRFHYPWSLTMRKNSASHEHEMPGLMKAVRFKSGKGYLRSQVEM
jgi:hypothetical protein